MFRAAIGPRDAVIDMHHVNRHMRLASCIDTILLPVQPVGVIARSAQTGTGTYVPIRGRPIEKVDYW